MFLSYYFYFLFIRIGFAKIDYAGSLALMEAAFLLAFSARRDIADSRNPCLLKMPILSLLIFNVLITLNLHLVRLKFCCKIMLRTLNFFYATFGRTKLFL